MQYAISLYHKNGKNGVKDSPKKVSIRNTAKVAMSCRPAGALSSAVPVSQVGPIMP
jgi:hypothetical protein